jgi:hypothetical protein
MEHLRARPDPEWARCAGTAIANAQQMLIKVHVEVTSPGGNTFGQVSGITASKFLIRIGGTSMERVVDPGHLALHPMIVASGNQVVDFSTPDKYVSAVLATFANTKFDPQTQKPLIEWIEIMAGHARDSCLDLDRLAVLESSIKRSGAAQGVIDKALSITSKLGYEQRLHERFRQIGSLRLGVMNCPPWGQSWRLLLDRVHHDTRGEYGFENERGYMAAMMRGLCFMLERLARTTHCRFVSSPA